MHLGADVVMNVRRLQPVRPIVNGVVYCVVCRSVSGASILLSEAGAELRAKYTNTVLSPGLFRLPFCHCAKRY